MSGCGIFDGLQQCRHTRFAWTLVGRRLDHTDVVRPRDESLLARRP